MPRLMTIDELEEYLRFSRKTLYRFLKQDDIPAIKIGNKWRFDKDVIDQWLRNGMKKVKARVLVVDDDELIRSLFKEVLEEEGHIVVTVETGTEGLTSIMQRDFDLVFLDLKLTGIDGAEILQEMRSIKPEIPVVIITGYPDSELMERAMRQGPLGVMLKPFDDSQIITATNNFLNVTTVRREA